MTTKPHCVTVTISSASNGVTNQNVILEEYAETEAELIYKNHGIADAVILALNTEMHRQSGEAVEAIQAAGGDIKKAKRAWDADKPKGRK